VARHLERVDVVIKHFQYVVAQRPSVRLGQLLQPRAFTRLKPNRKGLNSATRRCSRFHRHRWLELDEAPRDHPRTTSRERCEPTCGKRPNRSARWTRTLYTRSGH